MLNLGRLERVDLRGIWENEAQHFTPWLAREENLALLGDTIDIDLELEAQEQDVGPFRRDILCKDTANGSWVLIENQLERTDHTHLGQLMTFAAGLQYDAGLKPRHCAVKFCCRALSDDRGGHKMSIDVLTQRLQPSESF